MTQQIKRKRGRPRKNPIKDEKKPLKRGPYKKKGKTLKEKKIKIVVEPKRHIMLELIDYIDKHTNEFNRAYMNRDMKRLGQNKKYYIARTFKGLFCLENLDFDIETLKNESGN